MTISEVVTALAASTGTAIISMRSNKAHYNEIANDYSKSPEAQNNFQALETDNCDRLILIIDRRASDVGSGVVKLERRV